MSCDTTPVEFTRPPSSRTALPPVPRTTLRSDNYRRGSAPLVGAHRGRRSSRHVVLMGIDSAVMRRCGHTRSHPPPSCPQAVHRTPRWMALSHPDAASRTETGNEALWQPHSNSTMPTDQPDGRPDARSLAEKIDRLYRMTPPPPGRARWSDATAAAAIRAADGPSVSANYLYLLRTGQRTNPTIVHIAALAALFDVPPGYFFDDDLSRRFDEELALVAAVRTAGVADLALLTAKMSPRRRQTATNIMRELMD